MAVHILGESGEWLDAGDLSTLRELWPGEAVCPRCGEVYREREAALSRVDNFTHICPRCGQLEALEAWRDYKDKGGSD